jgi:hypothetical protein
MKVLGLMMFFVAFNTYAAESFVTRIHSVEGDLIKFQNARVGLNYQPKYVETMIPGELVKVTVNEDSHLIELEKLEDLEIPHTINSPFVDTEYHPTVLSSFLDAQHLLNQMRGDFLGDSQSFNLSHIWAYETYKKEKVKSQKAFLFFSDAFIRRTKNKYWFHVSPLVHYQTRELKVEEVILDKVLGPNPLTVDVWVSQLMKQKIHCPIKKTYSEAKEARDCALVKTSMYYWQPKDLEALEQERLFRVNFFDFELQTAFGASFGGHFLPK